MKESNQKSDKTQVNTQQVDQQTKMLKQLTDQITAMELKLEELRREKKHHGRHGTRPNS